MANRPSADKRGDSAQQFDKSTGSGTDADPFIREVATRPASGSIADVTIVGQTGEGLPVIVASQPTASVSNPMQKSFLRSAASTNATVVKAAPGNEYNLIALNKNSEYRFIHLVDKASAPTPGGETTNYLGCIPLPPGVFVPVRPGPQAFINNGLGFYLTAGDGSSTDSTAVGAGDVYVWMEYM